jgi:hypothetical protein
VKRDRKKIKNKVSSRITDHALRFCAHVAQLAEHILGKDEVTGSIPVMGFEKNAVIGNLLSYGMQTGLGNQLLFTVYKKRRAYGEGKI